MKLFRWSTGSLREHNVRPFLNIETISAKEEAAIKECLNRGLNCWPKGSDVDGEIIRKLIADMEAV